MCMIQTHCFKDLILLGFSIIFYYHFRLYSLGHGATIVRYCIIVMSDTMVAPECCFCQTLVQYDVTIVAP